MRLIAVISWSLKKTYRGNCTVLHRGGGKQFSNFSICCGVLSQSPVQVSSQKYFIFYVRYVNLINFSLVYNKYYRLLQFSLKQLMAKQNLLLLQAKTTHLFLQVII